MKLIRKPEKENEPVAVGSYIFKLIPYWPLFLALIVLSMLCSWVYLQFTTPLYQTTASIMFPDEKNNDAQNSKALESLDVISPKKTVDNEIEVIQSNDLIIKVVNDLNLYAPVYEESRTRPVLAYNSSPVLITSNEPALIKQTKEIPFAVTKAGVIINKVTYPLNKLVRTPWGRLRFLANPHQTQSAEGKSFYFYLTNPKKAVLNIANNIKVDLVNKQSSIIDIIYTDPNPERGEDILNSLIKFYNVSIDEEKNQLAANTAKFIDDRLISVENSLLDLEHQQQSYRSDRGAIDISTQGRLYLENVSTNDQKVSEINTQLSVLDQVDKYVRSKNLANGIVPSTVGVDDPGLTQMVKNVYELQLELESLKKTTGENNPLVVADADKIEKIRPQILENIQNQRQSLQASRNNLSNTNRTYSSQLQSMPETEKRLVDINRDLTLKSDIYTFLLQKKEQTALSFISNNSNSKIINSPESSELPVSPKRKVIYIAGILIALIAGGGIATGKESLQTKIMFQSDIESLTQLPVIGEISAGQSQKQIVINTSERTVIAEQFRRLRITLAQLGVGGIKKRVLITSAISGEGKSFVAINLAISLAITGKKVALLDFDLSKPSLHVKLNEKNRTGITEYLQGTAEVDTLINKTAASENLYFISAGKIADNPAELITNERAEELLIHLDNEFDYVIVDAAPVGPVSDAYILSPLCDATLYIIRHDYTPKIFVERIDRNNVLHKLNNAAIVFNDVSNRSFSNYGFGYGYGYVYGSKDEKKLNS